MPWGSTRGAGRSVWGEQSLGLCLDCCPGETVEDGRMVLFRLNGHTCSYEPTYSGAEVHTEFYQQPEEISQWMENNVL